VQSDLEEMIHSLTERGEEEQFQCDLFEGDLKRIDESLKMLFPDGLKNRSWDDLQEHLDRALATSDVDLATRVGLVFGEMMICEVPSFAWIVIFDDHGASRALALGDSGIVIFPEDMIFKRFERDERLDLTQFSSGILEMVENLFRKYQQAAGTGGVQS
jgi:hypothetical protein